MMKTIAVVTLGLLLSVGALTAQELTLSQLAKTRNYNHSVSGKIRYQQRLQKMTKISKEEAEKLAKEQCKEEMHFSKLSVRHKRLFYRFSSKNCYIKIDALDGSLVESE